MSGPARKPAWRRRLLLLVAAAVGISVVVGIAVPLLVSGERLKGSLARKASEALGRPVTIEHAAISVWTGPRLVFEGIEIGPTPGSSASETLLAGARGGAVRLALLPLLRGEVDARSVRVDGGTLRRGERALASDLRLRGRVRAEGSGAIRGSGRLEATLGSGIEATPASLEGGAVFERGTLRIESLAFAAGILEGTVAGRVSGLDAGTVEADLDGTLRVGATEAKGTVSLRSTGEGPRATFELRAPFVDFDEIRSMASRDPAPSRASWGLVPPAAAAEPSRLGIPPWVSALRADGTVEADGGRLFRVTLGPMRTPVRVAAGVLRADAFTAALHGGTARGTAHVRIADPALPFRAEIRLEGVRMETLAAEFSPRTGPVLRGTGRMEATVEGAAGSDSIPASLRGRASFALRDGSLTSVGLVKQAASFLEMAGGKGIGPDETPFERISADFEIGAGSARTESLLFRSADLELDGGGTVGLDGALALDVTAAFSKDASRGIVGKTPQLSFRVGPDGRLTVPMKIRGSLAAPMVQVDLERILEDGLEREIRKRGEKGILRKLLGRS
jgi:uncharacterized protein involved in outer membrane biogenesis